MSIVNVRGGRFGCVVLACAASAAALLATADVARAAEVATTLSQLIDDPTTPGVDESLTRTIVLGDKRYSGFSLSTSGDAPVNPNDVNVVLSSDDLNRYNLRFGFVRDAMASDAGERTDAVIRYRVDVTGAQRINGVGLAFDSTVTPGQSPGLAAAAVQEIVRTVDGSDLTPGEPVSDMAVLDVFNDGAGGLGDRSSSALAINPVSALLFEKDITVSSRPEGGRVVINTVDNFVNQVPEPASAALLAVAGLGLLARRRRK
jgi:hypothetical protein